MQYAPARRALAGSVLVLSSVGTVSAVHLESTHLESTQAPAGPEGAPSTAMAAPSMPPPSSGPATAEDGGSPARRSVATSPSRAHRASSARATSRTTTRKDDRPVTGRDLVAMAHGRRTGSVVVPVHDVERTIPFRSALTDGPRGAGRDARGDGFTAGLESLDDILDGMRTGDYRDDRPTGSRVGFHRADLSWDSDDVSFSRPRCGRHRA